MKLKLFHPLFLLTLVSLLAAAFGLCPAAWAAEQAAPAVAPATTPGTTPATPAAADESKDASADLKKAREELVAAKEEMAKLRAENQLLRKLLAESSDTRISRTAVLTAPPSTNTTATSTNAPAVSAADATLTHWLSTFSGKRHRAGCRYFKNSDGRPCDPTEGSACKLCGG